MSDSARGVHKILLVDDEPFILSATAKLLRNAGHEVHTCEQWAGVANTVRLEEPDLVLLDYNMPTLKGDDLCSILKRNLINPDMKIMLFSSEPEDFLRSVVITCGADGYIKKNVAGHVLLSRIEDALSSVA
jgi:two-component system OmpR family response regulator